MQQEQAIHPLLQAIEDKRIKDARRILDKTPIAELEPHLSAAFMRVLTDTTEAGLQLIDVLLAAKPSLANAPLMDGSPPLINAVIVNHLPTVQTLVRHGANFHAKNATGQIAEELAEELGNDDIKNYLAGLNQEYDIATILTAHQESSYFRRKEPEQKLAACLRRLLHATAFDQPLSLGTDAQTQQCLKIINDSSELLKLLSEENSEGFTLSYFLRDAIIAHQKYCSKLFKRLKTLDNEIDDTMIHTQNPLALLKQIKHGAIPTKNSDRMIEYLYVTPIFQENFYLIVCLLHSRLGVAVNCRSPILNLKSLNVALHLDDLHTAQFLCDRGATFDEGLTNRGGWMHYAKTPDTLRFLFTHGVDINSGEGPSNDTALHLAACEGNLALVQFLVENGANIYCLNWSGKRPLELLELVSNNMYLFPSSHQNVIRYLENIERLQRSLNLAILENNVEHAEFLIQKHGRHLLNFYAKGNHSEPGGKQSPLYNAKTPEMIRFLVQHGCSVHHVDVQGFTPLHNAVDLKFECETVRTLIEMGADITGMTKDGRTAAQLAQQRQAQSSHSNTYDRNLAAVVEYLCDLERSALDHFFSLIEKGDLDAIKAILTPKNARFYLTLLNLRGYSAVEWSVIHGKHDITFFLVAQGQAQTIFPDNYMWINDDFCRRTFRDEYYPAVEFLNAQLKIHTKTMLDFNVIAVTNPDPAGAIRQLRFLSKHFHFDPNTIADDNGNRLLHYANSPEVVTYLAVRNANVFARNNQGITPLEELGRKERKAEAAFRRLAEIVEVHMSEMRGYIERREIDQFKANFKDGMDVVELYATAINHRQNEIKAYLTHLWSKAGGYSARNAFGKTLLHYARSIEFLQSEFIEELANSPIEDREGCIALHDAARADAIDVVCAIVKVAPDQIWHKNKAQQTPFDCATGESKDFLNKKMKLCDEYFAHIAAGRLESIKVFRAFERDASQYRNREGLSDCQCALRNRQFACADYFMEFAIGTLTEEEFSYLRDFLLQVGDITRVKRLLALLRVHCGKFDAFLLMRAPQEPSLYYMLVQRFPELQGSKQLQSCETKINSQENICEMKWAIAANDFARVNSLVKLGFDCRNNNLLSEIIAWKDIEETKQQVALFNMFRLLAEHDALVPGNLWLTVIAHLDTLLANKVIPEMELLKFFALLWEKKGLNKFSRHNDKKQAWRKILLRSAVLTNYLHFAAFLTENNADENDKNPSSELTHGLIHYANTAEAIEFILSLGISIDARNTENRTALYNVTYLENIDLVKLLLKYGASFYNAFPNGKIPSGISVEMWDFLESYKTNLDANFETRMAEMRGYIERGETESFKAKFSGDSDAIQLYAYALDHNRNVIAKFIASKQDVCNQNPRGKTVVHFIRTRAALGRLIKANGKILSSLSSTPDKEGRCPLHDAADANALEVVQALVQLSPSDIWRKDIQKRLPYEGEPNESKQYLQKCESAVDEFFYAIHEGSLERIRGMIRKESNGIWFLQDLNIRIDHLRSRTAQTPFAFAVFHNQYECADFLAFTCKTPFSENDFATWQTFLCYRNDISRIQHYLKFLSTQLEAKEFQAFLSSKNNGTFSFYYILVSRYPSLRGIEAFREYEATVNSKDNLRLLKTFIRACKTDSAEAIIHSGFDCRNRGLFGEIQWEKSGDDILFASTNTVNLYLVKLLLENDAFPSSIFTSDLQSLCLNLHVHKRAPERLLKVITLLREKGSWDFSDQNNSELQEWLVRLLWRAIQEDNIPLAEYLIQQGVRAPHLIHAATTPETILFVAGLPDVDINAKNPDGCTALDQAAKEGNLENAKALIKAGASIYTTNGVVFYLPLNDEKCVPIGKFLATIYDKHIALCRAVEKNDLEEASRLLDEGFIKPQTSFMHASYHPLHRAVIHDHFESTQLLLNRGIQLSSEDVDFGCVRSTKIAQLLIDHGANPLYPEWTGTSPLHSPHSPEMIVFFLRHNVDINGKNINGCTPLHIHVMINNLSSAQALVENGANLFVLNKEGKIPYDCAEDPTTKAYLKSKMDEALTNFFRWIQEGDIDNVTAQLHRGIDLHWKNAQNKNALEWAIVHLPVDNNAHRQEIVTRLLSAGATLAEPASFVAELIQTQSEQNCLRQLTFIFNYLLPPPSAEPQQFEYAFAKNYPRVAKCLFERNPALCANKALMTKIVGIAVVKDSLELVKLCVEHDVITADHIQMLSNMLGEKAKTNACMVYLKPLFANRALFLHAVRTGNIAEMDRLMELGVKPELKSLRTIQVALQVKPKQIDAILHLLKKGVPFSREQQADIWMNDLFHAVITNDTLTVQRILEQNPWLIAMKNQEGHSIVHVAIETRHQHAEFRVLRYLGQNEILWPHISQEDKTALFFMYLEQGNIQQMADMIKRGFDPNVRDATGNTPLHNTTSPRIIGFLLENGCDINALNHAEWTALHAALWRKDFRTAKVLYDHQANLHIPCPSLTDPADLKKLLCMDDLIEQLVSEDPAESLPLLTQEQKSQQRAEKEGQKAYLKQGYNPYYNLPRLQKLTAKDSPIHAKPSAPLAHHCHPERSEGPASSF